MSKWTLQKDSNGFPVVVCEDIGKITSFRLVNDSNYFSVVNDIREYDICCQTLPVRCSGMVPIDISFNSLEREKFRDPIRPRPSWPIDSELKEKDLLGVIHNGGNTQAFCIDPRILALINGSVDLMIAHAKLSEYKKLYSRIPSKEKAEEYLRASGFTYGGFYTSAQLSKMMPSINWREVKRNSGNISILLD